MFKFTITDKDASSFSDELLQQWNDQILDQLIILCDEAIERQWVKFSPEGYNDQTGQLRSATGYLIYYEGKVMHERFELSKYGTDKAPGIEAGRKYAFGQHRESTGWGILFVAGMEYASWVEASGNGRTVITTAAVHAENNLLQRIHSIIV